VCRAGALCVTAGGDGTSEFCLGGLRVRCGHGGAPVIRYGCLIQWGKYLTLLDASVSKPAAGFREQAGGRLTMH
jgi:hypothetical protein